MGAVRERGRPGFGGLGCRQPAIAAGVWAFLTAVVLGLSLAGCGQGALAAADTRTIVDMGGRTVRVPQVTDKVFCSNPIGTVDIYMLDPALLAGWNFKPSGLDAAFIPSQYLALPSLGVWMGAGATPNIEEVRSVAPDVILCFWSADDTGVKMADTIQKQSGVPVVLVDYDIRSSAKTFQFLGTLLGEQARAEELASYCRDRLAEIAGWVASAPEAQRPTLFLAEGKGGLQTDPVGSLHVQDTFDLLGVKNVVDLPGTEGKGMGMPSVSIEQIVAWQPDVVLVSEYSMSDTQKSALYQEILADSGWRDLKAVQTGRVYRIPQSPFSWIGRPPSAARMLGCLWLAKVLYPSEVTLDLKQETKTFFKLFYRHELTDQEISSLFEASGVD
jgi:iron complex transport system substrate-binding protein